MPKGKPALSGAELELVYDYIASLDSAPVPTPKPSPTSSGGISYSQVKSKILTPYGCTNCHSVGTEAKLARWINVSSPSGSSFYTMVKNGSMPKGRSHVSAADQAFILQYLQDYSSTH